MTLSTSIKPSAGQFSLEHDLSPRDIRAESSSSKEPAEQGDHRFHGYPLQNFEKVKDSINRDSTDNSKSTTLDKRYGLPNLFDTKHHHAFGNALGLQYCGDPIPSDKSPRVVRDPFHDKTSAELQKYRHQQNEAESDIQRYKYEKVNKMRETEDEKKMDLQMLKSYNPWGKPGAGAPNKREIPTESFDTDSNKASPSFTGRNNFREMQEEYGDFHGNFGRPGGGAPLRTGSGRLRTELKGDTAIRFQDTTRGRQITDKEMRYMKSDEEKIQYSQELNKQVHEKILNKQDERIQELKKELESLKHDPYGKPGGGAPVSRGPALDQYYPFGRPFARSSNFAELRKFQVADNMKNDALPRSNDSEFYYNPWGKGTGQPRYNNRGDAIRYKFTKRDTGVYTSQPTETDNSLHIGRSYGGAGAPIRTESGHIKTKIPITMKRTDRGESTIKEDSYGNRGPTRTDSPEFFHFGTSGAGAPLRDRHGKVVATVYGKIQNETSPSNGHRKILAAQEYLADLQNEMRENQEKKEKQDKELKFGGGEFASQMIEGQVGKPRRDPRTGLLLSQHLPSTDATREKTNTRPQKNDVSAIYHTELERAAEERKQLQQLEKLRSNQEARHHLSTYNNFWGRPGAGAPNLHGNKMANFDNILYSPRRQDEIFIHRHGCSSPTKYSYVKDRINDSSHINMYEFPVPGRREPKKDYRLLAPFATEA